MDQISAADNHSIQFAPNRWRMLYHEKPLAEASDRGFRYGNRFGSTRRLPQEGLLTREDIAQVALGWERSDESWHLGLVLKATLAEERGSRWCELAAWPDPDHQVFEEIARHAGQELSTLLMVPFYFAEPEADAPAVVDVLLPPLPLTVGVWTLSENPEAADVLLLQRDTSWSRRKMGRVLWYFFWMAVYIVISVATLTVKIALPNAGTIFPDPQVLPYIGLGVALLLLGLGVNQLLIVLHEPDTIELDIHARTITARRGEKIRWSLSTFDIQSVYISEIIKKRAKTAATEYGELNLHLGGGQFQMMIQQEEPAPNTHFQQPVTPYSRSESAIEELLADRLSTPLQAMALYIARRLDVDVWLDLRVK